ncbi:hypothetical protein NGRRMQZB_83 [Escherichia phage Dru_SM1]
MCGAYQVGAAPACAGNTRCARAHALYKIFL